MIGKCQLVQVESESYPFYFRTVAGIFHLTSAPASHQLANGVELSIGIIRTTCRSPQKQGYYADEDKKGSAS